MSVKVIVNENHIFIQPSSEECANILHKAIRYIAGARFVHLASTDLYRVEGAEFVLYRCLYRWSRIKKIDMIFCKEIE